jgi:hypothetical protein
MISMRASCHPTAPHQGKSYAVIWFRAQPRSWDYRVVLTFKTMCAANAYMRWHNKWIDENVAR